MRTPRGHQEADRMRENVKSQCAVSHMDEQPRMTYPQLLWVLFFWVARRYFQP